VLSSPDTSKYLECRRLLPALKPGLASFFDALRTAGDDMYFHPHGLNEVEAERLCNYSGRDLYYAILNNGSVLAYGLLRGWDQGYAIPSLGVAVHPSYRSLGLGSAMVHFLHAAAKMRGARQVRLKVYPGNTRAIRLYEKVGYIFIGEESGQLLAHLTLR
jgi:[ribosomal protein S18]-alanine N-acetyltransferase